MAGTPENKQYQASASDVTELVVKASIADVTVTGADQSDIKSDYTEDRSIKRFLSNYQNAPATIIKI